MEADRDVGSCKSCPKGFYTNDQPSPDKTIRRNRCQECHRGTYGDSEKQETKEECKQCDVGRYSDDEGVAKESGTVCKACTPGKYSSEKGNDKDSKCKNCGSGTWSSTAAATSSAACQKCGIGLYSADVGVSDQTLCKSCELGFEQIEEGKAYCLPCTPGKFGEVKNDIRICFGTGIAGHRLGTYALVAVLCELVFVCDLFLFYFHFVFLTPRLIPVWINGSCIKVLVTVLLLLHPPMY